MDPIMWDCQTAHGGGSLSNFQRQILGDLYGDRRGPHREDPFYATDRAMSAPTERRRVSEWPGLAVVSVLAAMPLLMSLYATLL